MIVTNKTMRITKAEKVTEPEPKSYFNSSLPTKYYKPLKIEAINLNVTIRQHISNILEDYVKTKEEVRTASTNNS